MERIGPYQAVEGLGRGGFGAVWRAKDVRTGREVALKVLHAPGLSVEQLLRFQREAEALRRVEDAGLARLLDAGSDGGRPWLALELVAGESLGTRLRRGPLPPDEALRIVLQLARTLARLHAAGVIHRDVKPENVIVRADGTPVLLDLGLALLLTTEPRLTESGEIMGTPGYLAPEMVRGQRAAIGPATDVYQVGATLFALLCGVPPFVGKDLPAVLGAVVNAPAVPPSQRCTGLDPRIDALCMRCLAKRPEERFASMDALIAALERVLDRPRAGRGKRWPVALAAIAMIAGAAALIPLGGAEPPQPPVSLPPPAPAEVSEAERHLQRGQVALSTGRVELALEELNASIALQPDLVEARIQRGHARRRNYLLGPALEDYRRALELEPGRVEALRGEAEVRLLRWDLPDAVAACTRALLLAPKDPDLLRLRGDALERMGVIQRALEDYTRSLELRPAARAHLGRTRVRLQLQDVTGALEDFERAALMEPHLVSSKELEEQRRALELARQRVRELSKEAPSSLSDLVRRAEALEAAGEQERAVEEWSEAIQRARRESPGDVAGLLQRRAQVRCSLGELEVAEQDLREMLEAGGAQAHYSIALVRFAVGDFQGALRELQAHGQVRERSLARQQWMARAKAWLGDVPGAIRELEQNALQAARKRQDVAAITSDLVHLKLLRERQEEAPPPLELSALLRRAKDRRDAGDMQGASEDCARAVALDAGSTEARMARAAVRWDLSHLLLALRDLDAAIRLSPGALEPLVKRLNIRVDQGDWAGARDDVLEGLKLVPEDRGMRGGLARIEEELAKLRQGLRPAAAGDSAQARCDRALLLAQLGQRKEAEEELRQAATLAGDDPALLGELAVCKITSLDDGSDADKEIARALAANPTSTHLHVVEHALKLKRGDLEGAEASLQAALTLDPSNTTARVCRLALLEVRGELVEAQEELARLGPEEDTDESRARVERRLAALEGR